MTQSSNNTSQQNTRNIIIIIVVFLIVSVGFFFYIGNSIDEEIQANKDNTLALPQSVKRVITNRDIDKIEEQVSTNQTVNFNKYVYLREGTNTSESGEKFYYEFDTQMNEKLNTLQNVSVSDIDGIILYRLHTETIGYYETDDMLSNIVSTIGGGEKDKENTSSKKAMKLCVILSYVSVPDGIVLKADSIWGTEPPSRIKNTDNAGIGSLPDDDEIIKTIHNTIK